MVNIVGARPNFIKMAPLIEEMRVLTDRMRLLQQSIQQPGANGGGDEFDGAGEAE